MDLKNLRLIYQSIMLIILIGPKLTASYIFCHCDTLQCRQSGSSECKAEFYCYTVFRIKIPSTQFPRHGYSVEKSKFDFYPSDSIFVDRGCVANGISTKCSSDHKQHIRNGTILITYCCRDAWCNSEKVPSNKMLNPESKRPTSLDLGDLVKQSSNNILAATNPQDPIQSTNPNSEILTPKKSQINRVYKLSDRKFSAPPHDRSNKRNNDARRKNSPERDTTYSDQVIDFEMEPGESDEALPSTLRPSALTRPAYIAMGAALIILVLGVLLLSAAFYVYRKHKRLAELSLRGHHQSSNQSYSHQIPEYKYNQAESIFTVQKMNSAFLSHHDSQVDSTNENLDRWVDERPGTTAYGNINRCICCRRNISSPNAEPYICHGESESELSLADRSKKQCINNAESSKPVKPAALHKARTLPPGQITISWIQSQRKQERSNKSGRRLTRPKAHPVINSRYLIQQQSEKLGQSDSVKERKANAQCRQTSPDGPNKPVPWFTEIEVNKSTDGTVNSDPLTSAIYSGVSLNTDCSSSHDHNSDGALSSIIPCNAPGLFYQHLVHNTDIRNANLYLSPNHSPVGMQILDRQRGTGKTSSGGEESKRITNDIFDPKHNGWLVVRNFESSSGASTALTGRDTRNPKENSLDSPDKRIEGNLIGFANFRKAQESDSELVTPYAQFQLSPDSSVYDGC